MVELYVGGNRIGTWAEEEHLVAELATSRQKIELRDITGRTLGRFVPTEPSPFPDRAEIDRRCAAGVEFLWRIFGKRWASNDIAYQVVWLPSALEELAAIWLAASDRASVTAASHRIDRRLTINPLTEGESRDSEAERIAFEPPLQVLVRVSEYDRMVWVTAVAAFDRPSL
jgi:hypothetical protein